MQFFVVEKLGSKQALTPEGFLICYDVPLARTGSQLYRADEVFDELPAGMRPDEPVRVYREADQVFRPETVMSFRGKPVVDGHPKKNGERVDVTPENWRKLSVGHIENPHRGEGSDSELLLGDLVITHKDAIDEVRAGKREVSCGYDAKYVLTGPGRVEQHNILGNHVALVDDGRCGPRCSISDHDTIPARKDESTMAAVRDEKAPGGRGWIRGLLARAKTTTDAGLDELAGNAEKELVEGTGNEAAHLGDTHVHIHSHANDEFPAGGGEKDADKDKDKDKDKDDFAKRFGDVEAKVNKMHDAYDSFTKARDTYTKMHDDWSKHRRDSDSDWKTRDGENVAEHNKAIEGALQLEAPPGTAATDAVKAHDSSYLADSFQASVALAEIIVPGINVPAFDKKAPPRKTFDSMCTLRRSAIELAYGQPKSRAFVTDALGGRPLDIAKMGLDETRAVFFAVGAMARIANNGGGGEQRRTTDSSSALGGGVQIKGAVQNVADLQKNIDKFWKEQQG